MNLSSYYDQDGDVNMDGHSEPRGGYEEHKAEPLPSSDTVELSNPSVESLPQVDYKKLRAEARQKRYPSYFKGRSDPANEPAGDPSNPVDEGGSCFFKPERLDAKHDVGMASKVGLKMDKEMRLILDALAEDNGKTFASFLKKPSTARRAIQRLLRMKLPSFHQVRILTLWHLLRKDHADNVSVKAEDQEAVADYLAEVHDVLEFSFLAETRKRLMACLDDPSWVWLNFFKRLWVPDMGPELQTRIRALGPGVVGNAITPLIQAYHAANRPFRRFGASSRSAFPSSSHATQTEIEIPSMWFRSLFYPLLGGEPRGLFDDTPMTFKETLATMIS